MTGEIDWEPLKATFANLGPDSARRVGDARPALGGHAAGCATRWRPSPGGGAAA